MRYLILVLSSIGNTAIIIVADAAFLKLRTHSPNSNNGPAAFIVRPLASASTLRDELSKV